MDICVVLVTYNRKNDLQHTLQAYESQTVPPKTILVVDNHSTDGTDALLDIWQAQSGVCRRLVLTAPENLGGSGGFYLGMERALLCGCDWIFLSDDDAIPAPDVLERLQEFEGEGRAAALCCAVHDEKGIVTGHRARIKRCSLLGIKDAPVSQKEYQSPAFAVDFFSYIGACIRADALRAAGLCRREFFIYSDDFEHALRVGCEGTILCIPGAVMHHADNNPYNKRASWRDYYATRNLLLMYRAHFGRFAAARRAFLRRMTAWRSLDPIKMRVIRDAIHDAKKGITGKHPVYRPGWDPYKN